MVRPAPRVSSPAFFRPCNVLFVSSGIAGSSRSAAGTGKDVTSASRMDRPCAADLVFERVIIGEIDESRPCAARSSINVLWPDAFPAADTVGLVRASDCPRPGVPSRALDRADIACANKIDRN